MQTLICSLISKQFETEAVVERNLTLSSELLAEKYKDRLEESYKVKYLLLSNSTIYLLIRPNWNQTLAY